MSTVLLPTIRPAPNTHLSHSHCCLSISPENSRHSDCFLPSLLGSGQCLPQEGQHWDWLAQCPCTALASPLRTADTATVSCLPCLVQASACHNRVSIGTDWPSVPCCLGISPENSRHSDCFLPSLLGSGQCLPQ